MDKPPIIEVHNLVKEYKDGTRALNGINLTLTNKITAILGRNGAGKTTLIRILSSQLAQTSGSVRIFGLDTLKDREQLRGRVVSIPQEAEPLEGLSPSEDLEIYLSALGKEDAEIKRAIPRILKQVGLYNVRNKGSDYLSGGMKRKIIVAMGIASDADLVFLDEPTLALDPISRLEVWSAIRKLKGNIILTTHYLEEAKYLAHEIILIDEGKVSSKGTSKEIVRKLRGLVRVEGISVGKLHFRVGDVKISYLPENQGVRYARKGFVTKVPDLEDLFIMRGINEY